MRKQDFLFVLARFIHLLNFEGRKDSQTIFSYALRYRPLGSTSDDTPMLSYVINERPEILIELCQGYSHRESALPCGTVLREILKHEAVTAIILYDQLKGDEQVATFDTLDMQTRQTGQGIFWQFFKYLDGGAFEVTADAFTTFRVSLSPLQKLRVNVPNRISSQNTSLLLPNT